MSNRPALGGTVPLWGEMSRVPRRPCAGRILSRFGKKVTCATARPTCRMQSALSCIMSEHENRTGRYTTKDRARRATKHAYTCTHDHVPMPKSDGMGTRTAWCLLPTIFCNIACALAARAVTRTLSPRLQSAVLSCLFCLRSGLAPIKPHINEAIFYRNHNVTLWHCWQVGQSVGEQTGMKLSCMKPCQKSEVYL